MSKRAFIIHGWDGNPEEGIFPWLRDELQKRGFSVFTPRMPEPSKPEISEWVRHLKEQVGKPDEDTFILGHSVGAQTVLRYLETLETDEKIGGAVFLAGWTRLIDITKEEQEDQITAKPWLETPLDWNKIKASSDKFVAIFSDDDPLVPLSETETFADNLGAKIIIERGKKHFGRGTGIKELPSALEAILEISKG